MPVDVLRAADIEEPEYHKDTGDLPHKVPNDPRYFTADVHITPDGKARIGGHDGSKPVRLIGCDAAGNDFAKQLSKHARRTCLGDP